MNHVSRYRCFLAFKGLHDLQLRSMAYNVGLRVEGSGFTVYGLGLCYEQQ